ncbi:MAG TPA: hypothetical protein VIS06_15745, partial [Mycobacteriales bacterium]
VPEPLMSRRFILVATSGSFTELAKKVRIIVWSQHAALRTMVTRAVLRPEQPPQRNDHRDSGE